MLGYFSGFGKSFVLEVREVREVRWWYGVRGWKLQKSFYMQCIHSEQDGGWCGEGEW